MSLFSVQQNNDLRIRAQNIYGENFFIKDSPTGSWVPLKPGDSPSAELPYYIRPTEIEMDNGVGKGLVIDPTGVIFGDDAGNKKIDATFVRGVEDLDTQVDANTAAVDNLMPRMTAVEGVNTTQGASITDLLAKTTNIAQQGTTMLNLGFSSTISNRAAVTNSGLIVYNGTPAAASFPQVKISPTYIHFFKALNTSVFLDYDRVDTLAKVASVSTVDFNDKINFTKGITLPGAVESASTTNKKMVVMDATTKALSYATIPSGGSTLPYWVQPTSASLSNSTHSITVSPTDISFYRTAGNGNGEVFLLDYDTLRLIYDRSTRTNNWQETRWTALDQATMGVTAPTAVVGYEIKNFNKPLHFFSEMHRPGDILWVDLSAWNTPVGTTDSLSRGIVLSFKAFEYSENHTWEISYSGNGVTVSNKEVDVFNTGPESRRGLFISFKSNSGTVNVNGWMKIKLGNSFKTPVYPGVAAASPTIMTWP